MPTPMIILTVILFIVIPMLMTAVILGALWKILGG